MTTYRPNRRRISVWQYASLVLFAGLPPVLSLEEAVCNGIHCYDATAHCCIDDDGMENCCYQSFYEAAWFWCLLVIGTVLIAALLFCTCRAVYRYHNAGQYTKLRLQQPGWYDSATNNIVTVHMPTPATDINNQLPSYGTIADRPPPVYSVTDNQRQLNVS